MTTCDEGTEGKKRQDTQHVLHTAAGLPVRHAHWPAQCSTLTLTVVLWRHPEATPGTADT